MSLTLILYYSETNFIVVYSVLTSIKELLKGEFCYRITENSILIELFEEQLEHISEFMKNMNNIFITHNILFDYFNAEN